MNPKVVKDLTLPLEEYVVVFQDATLLDALRALESAQKNLAPGRQPHRAVLVIDQNRKIIGKIGQLAFLRALEPKYLYLGDLNTLSKAGLSDKFIVDMMENFSFLRGGLDDICRQARFLTVTDIMHPVAESIDENAPLTVAIHKIVMCQTLSLLVTREEEVVGILRLSDLFAEISNRIIHLDD